MANKNIELQFVSNLCLSKALSHNYIKNWCENKNTPMEVIPKKNKCTTSAMGALFICACVAQYGILKL